MMDLHPDFPFKKIAVAIGFSPRLEAIIAEASRLKKLFNASITFIHVGDLDEAQERVLRGLMEKYRVNTQNDNLIWEAGEPVEKIIEITDRFNADLLVAGALEKESIFKYILGGIARNLCRKSKCSILMLREPDIKAHPVKRIVVEGSDHYKTAQTIETAISVAKRTGAEILQVVQEQDVAKTALIRSDVFTNNEADEHKEKIEIEEVAALNHILSCADCGNLKIQTERLDGKPGYVISNFAREQRADLLVLNSPDTKLNLIDRVFPHDIEFALADLPCDLLVVHSKETHTHN